MTRNFKEWLSTFRPCIADYGYYADFDKITKNIDNLKVELNILNSLVGSKNIEQDFENFLKLKHPNNNNVRAKIRQQLQFLRDYGYLTFTKRGEYTLL